MYYVVPCIIGTEKTVPITMIQTCLRKLRGRTLESLAITCTTITRAVSEPNKQVPKLGC